MTAPGRGSIGYALGALLLLAVVAFGLLRLRRQPWLPPLALAALLGLLIALPLPGLAAGLARLPGGGLFRDGERFLVGWVLLAAIGFGAGVEAIAERLRPASVLLAGLPVVLLPGLAWGVAGALAPVHYPADYSAVSRLIDSDPRPGAVLVLPFTAYRHYSYDAGRTQLDPLPRWLDRTVIASADLPVRIGNRQLLVPGEDRLAGRAAQLLAGPDAAGRLAALGVRWVVLDAGDAEPELPGSGLRPVFAGATLRVYELAGVDPDRARHPSAGYAAPVAADRARRPGGGRFAGRIAVRDRHPGGSAPCYAPESDPPVTSATSAATEDATEGECDQMRIALTAVVAAAFAVLASFGIYQASQPVAHQQSQVSTTVDYGSK